MRSAKTGQRNARDVRVDRRHSNPSRQSSSSKKRLSIKSNARKRTELIGASNVMLSTRFASLGDESVKEKGLIVSTRPKYKKQAGYASAEITKIKKKPLSKSKSLNRTSNNQSIPQFQQQKINAMTQKNRVKRQEVVKKRRKGLQQVQSNKMKTGGNKTIVTPAGKESKSKTLGSVNCKKEKKVFPIRKKKAVNGDQLDVEMDAYWHEGGKGPNPKAAQLDRQMEQYWAKKSDAEKQPVNENSQA